MVKKDPWFRNRLVRDAIYEAIYEAMQARPEIYLLGEGAHMKVHFDAPNIERGFKDRIVTMPISEDANSNFAVGMSLAGLVPIVDVISSDFLFRTMDAICNTMAKSGTVGKPRTMIVRAEFLTGGPTSGQRIESLFCHIPGLRVVVPSNPADAYACMRFALTCKQPTIFFEDREIVDTDIPDTLKRPSDTWPASGCRWAIGHPNGMLHISPKPITIVSYGIMCHRLENLLRDTPNIHLLDLRTLSPLDTRTILESVTLTSRLLIVEPSNQFMGIGAEIAAQVAQKLKYCEFYCEIIRVGGPHKTIPASREKHDEMLPSNEQILQAIGELMR